MLCPFSKIIVLGFKIYPATSSWPGYSTKHQFAPVDQDISAIRIRKFVGHPYNTHATISPIGVSCQAGDYCSLQSSQLVKTADGLFP